MQKVLNCPGFAIDQVDEFGDTMLHSLAVSHAIEGVLLCLAAEACSPATANEH
jgi:hypothetical protein